MTPIFNIIFLASSIISALGLIYIIYARNIRSAANKLYVLALMLVIGYLVSHAVHFLMMRSGDVTILDQSCHSFLLLIILVLTFFSYYFPSEKDMSIWLKILLILPTLILIIAIWSGYLVEESHAHHDRFEANYTQYYSVYLIWYVILLLLSIYFLLKKISTETKKEKKVQVLTILIGLIITNLTAFVFGLYLPWILGFYYLVEISPLAFFIGVILTTTIAITKFNMFPAAVSRIQAFSLNKKVFFAAIVVVPIIILLVQIPLGRVLFNIQTSEEWQRYFLSSIAGGLLVSTAMAFIISRVIANPINKLTEKTSEIQKGNYGIKVDIYSNDEIGLLARTFNEMSETLNNDSVLLRENQNKIRMLFNAFEKSSAAICAFDLTGSILEINSQFLKFFNSTKTRLLNNNLYTHVESSEDLKELADFVKNFRYNKISESEIKIIISGNVHYFIFSITPFFFDTEKVAGYLLIAVDISELKKLEKQLIKSEKLAALGEMAAVLAHEIKTPLTSIKMNSDMLAESLNVHNEDKESINIINREITRLNNLVKEVLQFARQVEIKKNVFDIKGLIDDIIIQTKKKFDQKNFNIINNCKSIKVNADREKLLQVILNIIENSYEAAEMNGILKIESVSKNNNLCLLLIDNGNGIEKENHEKIFEPFYTTKSSGTGLGLAIARKIIEQHHGQLNLRSSNPGETIFEICLKEVKE